MDEHENSFYDLPSSAVEFIDRVVKNVRYRKTVRQGVRDELVDHFFMALSECDCAKEKEAAVQDLIEEFGDIKMLAGLIRRGKKRCRPLWKKVLIRSFQVFCIFVLFVLVRAMYFEIGSPNVSVDYSQWLNELVRQGRDEELNAKPYYDKAMELSLECPESLEAASDYKGTIDDVDSDELKKYLEEMKPAFEALRQGVAKPYYWPDYSIKKEIASAGEFQAGITESQIKSLGKIKQLAQSLSYYQIPWDVQNGNVKAALEDCNVLRRFGGHYVGRGLLIEQLVGVAVEAMAIYSIETILYENEVDTNILKWLQKEIEDDIAERSFVFNRKSEKALWLDWIQRGFTDDGNGNGRVLREGLPLVVTDGMSGLSGFFFGTYPDRREVTESIESFFESMEKKSGIVPWQMQRDEGGKVELADFSSTSFLLNQSFQSFYRVNQMGWRIVCERNALVAIFGILRYKQEKGGLPASLGELVVAGYLRELPFDPFSGDSLVYRREGEGFVLYSFGSDLKDDGGVLGKNKAGKPNKWHGTDGDAVFWPLKN